MAVPDEACNCAAIWCGDHELVVVARKKDSVTLLVHGLWRVTLITNQPGIHQIYFLRQIFLSFESRKILLSAFFCFVSITIFVI